MAKLKTLPELIGKVEGLYTCKCHTFHDFYEAKKEERKILEIGDEVTHRCGNSYKCQGVGVVVSRNPDNIRYVMVKFDQSQEFGVFCHVQELIKVNK